MKHTILFGQIEFKGEHEAIVHKIMYIGQFKAERAEDIADDLTEFYEGCINLNTYKGIVKFM